MTNPLSLQQKRQACFHEPWPIRFFMTGLALLFLFFFLGLPLAVVFSRAMEAGWTTYWQAISDPDTLSAIRLTLLAAVIALPFNVIFGIMASWAIAKYEFRGKRLLITLIDLPLSVSPVISGMTFVLLFGARGILGPWLDARELQIVFATPGIILATLFVTFPYVARELIPLMQSTGSEEEEVSLTLGAGGWQTFFRVTLPGIKWGLLYGIILSNARAMGEFGAVSVVSGHIRGLTNTLPLHVEILYNDYQMAAAFAVASLLALLAVFTLVVKSLIEWQIQRQRAMSEGFKKKDSR
jgi:sulfate transport system permease protein